VAQQPIFSIVIPTYNRPQQLAACLQAVARLDYARDRFEVIVVDDGSAEQVTPVVAPWRNHLAVTLLQQANAGPATARNAGAERAQGHFLAFTDDDCVPDARWLHALAAHVTTSPGSLIGGRVLNAFPHNPYAEASQHLIDYLYVYFNDDSKPGRFFPSNNLAIAAERFRTVGGFDPSFRLAAGEDRDFCARCQEAGYPLRYAPEAVVHHASALNLRDFLQQHFRYGRGALQFQRTRARQEQKPDLVKPFSFYQHMILSPGTQREGWQTLVLPLLLILTQGATAAGFYWEWLKQKM
jgi:GT2 family glycosyltransferase